MPQRLRICGGRLALAAFALLIFSRDACAQGSSLFGAQGGASQGFGASGSGGFGQTGSGTGAAGSGFGGGGAGNQGGGFGQTGQSGQGQLGATSGANGQQPRFIGTNNTGRFVGSGQTTPQTGANSTNRNQLNGGMHNGAANRGAGRPGGAGGTGNAGFSSDSGSAPRKRAVRPQHRVAFAYPIRGADTMSQTLGSRFQNLSSRSTGLQSVRFNVEGGQVTLRGTVDSPETRTLAEHLVRLEPGVRSIRNELSVAPASP